MSPTASFLPSFAPGLSGRALAFLILVFMAGPGYAIPIEGIESLVVFGDDLSDVGREPDPTKDGQSFTWWVDRLAQHLEIPSPEPYLGADEDGGTNFAHAGARILRDNGPWVGGVRQVNEYLDDFLEGAEPPADALVVLWLGTYDMISDGADPVAAADAVGGQAERLLAAGARKMLIPNLLPMEMMLENAGNPAQAEQWAEDFNAQLSTQVAGLRAKHAGALILEVDMHALYERIRDEPGAYGFENLNDALQLNSALDPETTLWWDMIQPSSAAHAVMGSFAYSAIAEAMTGIGADVRLSLEPSEDVLLLRVEGPVANGVTIEVSTDARDWTTYRVLSGFSGDEALEVDVEGARALFFRAR